jgi:hypothetical protein
VRIAVLAALAFLGACGQQACNMEVTRDVSFTAPNARETVIVRALGPSCDEAVGVYAIHDAEGRPIWSWSEPLPRAFGRVFENRNAMEDFLQRWAQPALSTTQTAPEFSTLQPGQTTLDRLTYEDIRARNLPMLCHFSGTAREVCVFWEPAAGGAGHFYDRDAEETEQ